MVKHVSAVLLCCVALPGPVSAQAPGSTTTQMSKSDVFAFADRARDSGDYKNAEVAYRALANDPDIEMRSEARFRLGMMLADRQRRFADAAVEFRKVLDEKPAAARVRLELARVNALMGRLGAAEREIRAAQAAGLPPEVEQLVRFYANALSAAKPVGGSIELAIAPDTNINRATKSDTLGTIIGDFTLDRDAQAKSGIGLTVRGQAFLRQAVSSHANLLARLSTSADLYRTSAFDDMVVGVQIGPEINSRRDKLILSAGPTWRWYGLKPFSASVSGSAIWQHPTGKRSQMRVEANVARVNNRRSDLQDGWTYATAIGLDRAFTARAGGGIQLSVAREAAADAGYATWSGGVSGYAFREFGKTTLAVTLGYNHLAADARIFLYPNRRIDDRFSASVAGTFRTVRIGRFAPFVRIRWDYNRSSVELYDYRRLAGEFGITSAF